MSIFNIIESTDLSDEQRVGLQQYFAESTLAPKLRRRLQPHTVREGARLQGESVIHSEWDRGKRRERTGIAMNHQQQQQINNVVSIFVVMSS